MNQIGFIDDSISLYGAVARAHDAKTMYVRLMPEDFDWLRKLRAAKDADRAAPRVPAPVCARLREFGLVAADDDGSVTERGRGALLEQDMRDAEER